MRVEDNYGVQFKVSGGDPANGLVLALKRRYFDYVVLPRHTLITGTLTEDVPFGSTDTKEELLREARLEDCLAVLRGL